jgi:hypothetical protein
VLSWQKRLRLWVKWKTVSQIVGKSNKLLIWLTGFKGDIANNSLEVIGNLLVDTPAITLFLSRQGLSMAVR